MDIKELPTDQESFIALIASRIDPALEPALEAAHTAMLDAHARLQAHQAELTAHLASNREADPLAWAIRQRDLTDASEVYEAIVKERRYVVQVAMAALQQARLDVGRSLHEALQLQARHEGGELWKEVQRLKQEIQKLKRGEFAPLQEIGQRLTALKQAATALDLPALELPIAPPEAAGRWGGEIRIGGEDTRPTSERIAHTPPVSRPTTERIPV
jgi:hypothetical protein